MMLSAGERAPVAASGTRYSVIPPGNHLWYYRSPLDQTLQPYYVYIPRGFDPQAAHPVVVFLHGFGGRASRAAPDAWRQNWADSHGWILARADGRGSQNWDFIGEDDLYLLIADLEQTTPFHSAIHLDRRRLYLEGGSMGGHGGYREAFRYPDRFAAIAPAAGWTTYKEFYAHWYDRTDSPHMPDYVDPARRPVLETASSLWQAANGRNVWLYLVYDTNDGVNPPVNQQEVLKKLQTAGSDRFATRVGRKGHVGSYSAPANYAFFLTKSLAGRPPDIFYTTNDLHYNRSYWLTIDRLQFTRQWGSVDVHVTGSRDFQRIEVRTKRVLGFTLNLAGAPLDLSQPVYVAVDGSGAVPVVHRRSVTFCAQLDSGYHLRSWLPMRRSRFPRLRKRPGLSGPLADAFRTPFVVLYGTRHGTLPGTVANPDWVAAQHFAAEWNGWMTLHWRGGEKPPAARRTDWWTPPYPFSPGPLVPGQQPILTPLPDTAFTEETLPTQENLILFGDPTTNWVIAGIASDLPLALSPPGAVPGIRVAGRLYQGPGIHYFFLAPNPLNRDRYVVLARGYLSSRVDPAKYGAGKVGKDLEALPFYWPDYVVWDSDLPPSDAKQKPFRYLPATFLDAGYFAENWRLDTTPPRTQVKLDRLPAGQRYPDGAIQVTLTATDAPGGFGVAGIEYRLDDGPWRRYTAPFAVVGLARRQLSVRATDRCGQFVYDHTTPGGRGLPAPGNVEAPQTVPLDFEKRTAEP